MGGVEKTVVPERGVAPNWGEKAGRDEGGLGSEDPLAQGSPDPLPKNWAFVRWNGGRCGAGAAKKRCGCEGLLKDWPWLEEGGTNRVEVVNSTPPGAGPVEYKMVGSSERSDAFFAKQELHCTGIF